MDQGGGSAESSATVQALSGVRFTDPTGDVRLIQLSATQPSWVRRRNGRWRAVCRDAMADRLPPSIAERTRRGAQLPDWLDRMAAAKDELVTELAAARDSQTCRELLDLDRIDAAIREWPDRASIDTSATRTAPTATPSFAACSWRAISVSSKTTGATDGSPP